MIRTSKKVKKFTIVELLVVFGIIAVLTGISVGVARYVSFRNGSIKTQTLMKQLELGLEAVKNKYGYYPKSSGGGFVLPDPSSSSWSYDSHYPKKYVELFLRSVDFESLKKAAKKDSGKDVLCDYWETPIYYKSPGDRNKGSFDLISAGPDRKYGSGQTDSVADADPENSDDMANF